MNLKYIAYRLKWWFVDKTGYIPKAPINLDLELAGKCNLKCTMCHYGMDAFDVSKQGMMDKNLAYKALDEAKEIGVKSVKFNFRGEPGLYKDLTELISYAKSLGFVDVFINTNMLAFNKDRLEKLALSGLDKIIISVDGADQETYEKIRVGGNFQKLKENIRYYQRWLRIAEKRTKVILQMVGEKPDPKLKDIIADEYRFVRMQDRSGNAMEGRKRRRCPQPRQRIIVAWDGTLFPCCSNWENEYPLGNYKDMSLIDAWNGERMANIRNISVKCDQFPCKKCQVGVSYK